MSAFNCVVVWEWFDDTNSKWMPYGPAVTQHLERAYAKQLTRVILSDADPSLQGCYVNLRTQTQCIDRSGNWIIYVYFFVFSSKIKIAKISEGSSIECGIRRMCYSVNSPGGRRARWEWARNYKSQSAEIRWDTLPMDVQCQIEEAWSTGDRIVDLSRDPLLACPWRVDFNTLTAAGPGGALKIIRRINQDPYPLTKVQGDPSVIQGRRMMSIPHQHTGSSTKSTKSIISTTTVKSNNSIANRAPAKLPVKEVKNQNGHSNTQRDKTKSNLARQILHNLNIFSNKSTTITTPISSGSSIQNGLIPPSSSNKKDSLLDVDSSSTRSGRRPSVDTISTYLSHESKDSLNQVCYLIYFEM